MDIKFVPVKDITAYLPCAIAVPLTPQRSWPFKLSGTNGEEIYLNVYEGEIRGLLKQMSEIVGGLDG